MNLCHHLLGLSQAPRIAPPHSAVRTHSTAEHKPVSIKSQASELAVLTIFDALEDGSVLDVRQIMAKTGLSEFITRGALAYMHNAKLISKQSIKKRALYANSEADIEAYKDQIAQPKTLFCKSGFHRFTGPYEVIESRKNGKLINSRIICAACAEERNKTLKEKDAQGNKTAG